VTSDGRIKILDFGVAKLQSGPDESGRTVEDLTTITRSGMVLGTVAYMAPEQLRGKPVDHRSDIFSVGAILYEMLPVDERFRGETEVDTITAVLRETPPESDLEQAGIPYPSKIVRHCLEKDPEKRFQSAGISGSHWKHFRTAWRTGHASGPRKSEPEGAPLGGSGSAF